MPARPGSAPLAIGRRPRGLPVSTALGNVRSMPLSSAQYRMRRLFTEDFNAADIADPCLSFDAERRASEVRDVMVRKDATVAGVRVDGLVAGYVRQEDLDTGTLGDAVRAFAPGEVIPYTAGFHDVLAALAVFETVFVTSTGTVSAVIDRRDLQSAPVRMWLFGLITILESFVSRELEARFPDESWTAELSAGRLAKARELLAERQRRNLGASLVDCLQFGDKAGILVRQPDIREEWGFESKRQADRQIQDLQSLRNHLAHAQDILTYDWATILELAQRLDTIITRI